VTRRLAVSDYGNFVLSAPWFRQVGDWVNSGLEVAKYVDGPASMLFS
jgi:hypothetical protein